MKLSFLHSNIETDRLLFRKLSLEDVGHWDGFVADERATRYVPILEKTENMAAYWIQKSLDRYKADGSGLHALIDKNTGNFVGQCGLLTQVIDGNTEIEIGYHLLPAYWGQGYATEAAMACKRYAFDHLNINSVISIIHVDNVPSQRVAERIGMQRDRKSVFKGIPVFVYEVERES